jgi:cyclophilin family peptidyl-prolyl cis-trans isomerase
MKRKRLVTIVILCLAVLSFGFCKPVEKKMKALEGKEGLFAVMETSEGTIVLELYYKLTPLTVTNFVGLAEGTLDAANGKPFYDGLTFHRVIKDFMIQGGDPLGTGTGGPGYKFPDEFVDSLKFDSPGVLAMANAGPGTNGSQFFITHKETPWLNGHHTIFGHVVEGQDVVNAVKQGDKIVRLTIVRQGKDAEAFTATQESFNKRLVEAAAKEKDKKAALNEAEIRQIEQKFPGYEKNTDGIYYKTTAEGHGEKIGKNRSVAVEYKGYLTDGTVFDQSKGRGPLEFSTNAGRMIPGFDIMVQDMKLGEKRTIVIPPELAYGERGYPGVIPANAYIAFDIELVRVK